MTTDGPVVLAVVVSDGDDAVVPVPVVAVVVDVLVAGALAMLVDPTEAGGAATDEPDDVVDGLDAEVCEVLPALGLVPPASPADDVVED